jgi:hypothetical protein
MIVFSTIFSAPLHLQFTILMVLLLEKPTLSKCLLDRVNYCCYYETRMWLTKQRTFHRIFGTILGALLLLEFFLVHDSTIIGGLAIIALFGFSFTPTNYKVGHIHHHLCHLYLRNSSSRHR